MDDLLQPLSIKPLNTRLLFLEEKLKQITAGFKVMDVILHLCFIHPGSYLLWYLPAVKLVY